MGKTKYDYVPIPKVITALVDKSVINNSYPLGKYHSRAHYVLEAVKAQLHSEGFIKD